MTKRRSAEGGGHSAAAPGHMHREESHRLQDGRLLAVSFGDPSIGLQEVVTGAGWPDADRVVWGTDSVWYGSPQWQIEALRRLEIPDDMMEKIKWNTRLGDETSLVKTAIFGINSANVYSYELTADVQQKLGVDKIAEVKEVYRKAGGERNNAYYGYIGKQRTA